jgi:DNA-binding NtrC family response regulator
MLLALGHDSVDEISPDAIYQVPPCRPELILLGFDLARADAIRLLAYTHCRFPSRPIILLANSDQDSWMRRALWWGATAVLRFPLPASQLQAAVVQTLGIAKVSLRPESERKGERTVGQESSFNESPVPSDWKDEPTVAADALSNESHDESDGSVGASLGVTESIRPLKEALEAPEREIILQALRACGWSRNETARVLEINRSTLHKKMKKHGLFDLYRQPRAPIGAIPLSVDRPGEAQLIP